MAKDNEQGEMTNVMGVQGATLTVIGDEPKRAPKRGRPKGKKAKPKAEPQPEPQPAPVVPAAPKKVRVTIQAEFGSFAELVEGKDAAMARAEEIIARGAWQQAGNQMILHSPTAIKRVMVVE